MIKFSREKVLLLHQLITQETGGDPNLRDAALLESALESAFVTFDGKELYPTKEEKGAKLGFSLISNHAFVDGNKRIGMYVLLSILPRRKLPASDLPWRQGKWATKNCFGGSGKTEFRKSNRFSVAFFLTPA